MTTDEITRRLQHIERKFAAMQQELQRQITELERLIKLLLDEMETGPENSREEVAPMGKNTTRDWSRMRLAAAS